MADIIRLYESFAEKSGTPARVVPLDLDEAKARVEAHCPGYTNRGFQYFPIYRGARNMGTNAAFVTPSATRRKSANTINNAYNLVISSYDGYPDRLESLICSTSYPATMTYGTSYVVIPALGATVAVCPKSDIWYSYPALESMGIDTLDDFSNSVEFMLQQADLEGTDVSTMPALLDALQTIDKYVAENGIESMDNQTYGFTATAILRYAQERNLGLYDAVRELLNPDAAGFKTFKYGEETRISGGSKELWTSSPSIMIEYKEHEKLYPPAFKFY